MQKSQELSIYKFEQLTIQYGGGAVLVAAKNMYEAIAIFKKWAIEESERTDSSMIEANKIEKIYGASYKGISGIIYSFVYQE